MTSISLLNEPATAGVIATTTHLAEGQSCFLVGGAVRDQIMERASSDVDVAIDGDAPAFARKIADALGGHYALLDDQRRTARVILGEGPVRTIDVTRLRGDILADLGKRDFTIDAMAVPLAALAGGEAVEVLDPHGGSSDIENRTLRLVSDQALIDDPLRLLRAVRLAVELDFDIEPATSEGLRRHAKLISQAAPERVRDEISRAFQTPRAALAVRLMDGLGLLDALLPEVTVGRGVTQPKEHYYDVLEHNLETVAALDIMLAEEELLDAARSHELHRVLWDALAIAPDVRVYLSEEMSEGRSRATLIKLTGLLHDVAKPQTRAPDATGRIRFFGHADLGAAMARKVMQRLRFSRRETDFVATIVDAHLRPGQLGQDGPPSRRAMYRFFRDTREAAEGVLLLSLADALAARGPRMTLDAWRQMAAYIAYLLSRRHEDESMVSPPRLITGDDLMRELGIAAGPEVGRLLATLEEAQAAGEVTSRDAALEFVRRTQTRRPRDSWRRSGAALSRDPRVERQDKVAAGGAR